MALCMWPTTTPIMNPLNYPAKSICIQYYLTRLGPGSAEFIKEYGYEDETTAPGNSAPKGPDKNPSIVMILLANIRACENKAKRSYH